MRFPPFMALDSIDPAPLRLKRPNSATVEANVAHQRLRDFEHKKFELEQESPKTVTVEVNIDRLRESKFELGQELSPIANEVFRSILPKKKISNDPSNLKKVVQTRLQPPSTDLEKLPLGPSEIFGKVLRADGLPEFRNRLRTLLTQTGYPASKAHNLLIHMFGVSKLDQVDASERSRFYDALRDYATRYATRAYKKELNNVE